MREKIKNYTLGVCVLLLSVLILASCTREDYVGEKASVTMTFLARVGNDTEMSENDLLPNESMKTLRVIVVRNSTKEVLYNVKYNTFDKDENGRWYKTITFSELTVKKEGEDFVFYAVANEATFGGISEGKDIDITKLDNLMIDLTTGSTDEPLSITENGIPQTNKMTVNISPTSDESLTMQLEFVVAKVDLTFHNTTNAPQDITDLRFIDIMPENTQTSLLKPEEVMEVGDRDLNLEKISVEGQQTVTKTFYIYETKASDTGYQFLANWITSQNVPLGLSEIGRGENLKIDITLKKQEGLKVNWVVKPWDGEDTDLEFTNDFNGNFSGQLVKIGQIGGKNYIWTAEGMDSQQRERYAQFKFVMTSPVGQNWVAHLSNPNDFEFVGDYAGTGVTQSDAENNIGVVTLTVKPRREFQSGEIRTTQLYIMVDGLEGAQLINNPIEDVRPFPGENNYVELIQVSTADYDTNSN